MTKHINRNIYTATAFPNRKPLDDKAGENGHGPDVRIKIDGLDEKAIWDWFVAMKHTDPTWRTLSHNCSTVVASALQAGGAPSPQEVPLVWDPTAVKKYADYIRNYERLVDFILLGY